MFTREQQQHYRESNRARTMMTDTTGRVKKLRRRGKMLPLDIDYDWVVERLGKGRCEATGLPFEYKTRSPFIPSLDQKIPGGGYTKENTQVVVLIYNHAKHCGSHDDVCRMAAALSNTAG